MKKIFTTVAMASLLVVVSFTIAGAKADIFLDDNTPLEYERYEKTYFVRNDSGVPDGTSFHMFTDLEKFEKVFHGVYRTGGTYVKEDTFESRFVIAIVQQGKFTVSYMVTNVARQKDKLRIAYETTKKPTPTSTQRNPLILAIDNADFNYSEIIFTENGKDVYKVDLKD